MYRRLWSYKVVLVIFGFILLFSFMNPTITTLGDQRNRGITNDVYHFDQSTNATFDFLLNSSLITRGEDDLILHFRFVDANDSSVIPDSYIYFNITSASDALIYEKTLPVLISEYVNETVIWSTFNSLNAGIYSVNALANSSTTENYQIQRSFELKILQTGKVRMFFPENPAYIYRNESSKVNYAISNIGSRTVTNVTLTNIESSGTLGSVEIYIDVFELELADGETFQGNIRFDPDIYLYKKYSFSYSYRTIDEPAVQIIGSSDPLDIIVNPYLDVDTYEMPINVTMGETYDISFTIDNNEIDPLFIVPKIDCDEMDYDNNDASNNIKISSGEHFFIVSANPITEGVANIRFWIEIEWETITGTKWYSTLMSSIIRTVFIYPIDEIPDGMNLYYAYGIIFASMFIGIVYFSRDVIRRLASKGRLDRERQFPEVVYPLDTVILDGSNIAWEEKGLSDKPKISNVEAMINRLSRANFKKIVTVADAALRYQIDNQRRLDKLVKDGAMKMLPARVDGDKFILRLAEEENAMI
ncbi:MAG: NYN domain-containing protein, partial [Candidatus Heimdallarchaeaceae archaeon]